MKFVVTGADTWTSNGLRGSGSDDWMVNDHFIPEERTFNLARLSTIERRRFTRT
jgi:hypothetical protein